MAKKSRFWASVALLWTMLMPSLVQAAPAAGKPAANKGLETIPLVGPYLQKLVHALTPDLELWWIFAITFPLTLVWMTWGSGELKNFFNKVGGVVACGLPALALLGSFWGAFLGIALLIFGKVTGLLALATNPSWKGAWDMFLGLLKLIPVIIVIWILKKIPGLEGLVREILGKVSELARKIWGYRETIYQNPHLFWQILGGLLLALLINSRFATHLSEMVLPDVPGIIPGISGAVGLFFFFFRTVGGRKLVGKLAAKPLPNGDWPCLKCSHFNVAANEACGKCGTKNPFLPWTCQDCTKGYAEDISWDVKRCPKCGKERSKKTAAARATPPSKGDKVNAAAKATTRYRIADPASPPTTATAAAAPTGTAAAPTTPCPHCGEQNRPQAVFCRKCRGKMGERSLADEALDEPFARN